MEQIIVHTERRMLGGELVPAADKLSISDAPPMVVEERKIVRMNRSICCGSYRCNDVLYITGR